jgi:hypothetical protein
MSQAMPQARSVGRLLRFLVGALLIIEASRQFAGSSSSLIFQALAAAVGLSLLYAALHVVVSRFFPGVNPWLGAVLALTPMILVYALGGAPGQIGSVLFIGVSLVLTAIRADGGCEVMTIPAMLFGERTHLVCIVFSPLDRLEKLLGRRSRSTTGSENELSK